MSIWTGAVLRTKACLNPEWTFEPCWTRSWRNFVSYTLVCTHCESEPRGVSELDPCAWWAELLAKPPGRGMSRPSSGSTSQRGLCAQPSSRLKEIQAAICFDTKPTGFHSTANYRRNEPLWSGSTFVLLGLPSIIIQKTLTVHLTLLETSLLGLLVSLSDRLLHRITLAFK